MSKGEEHREQAALISWAAVQQNITPELALLFAVPNGGHRHIAVAGKLKAEGVRAGVPDLFLPVPRNGNCGLFIEMKAKGGKTSSYQKWWLAELAEKGYRAVVCLGFEAARQEIMDYLGIK